MALSIDLKSYSHSFIPGAKYFCHIWVKLNDLFTPCITIEPLLCSFLLATDKPVISLIASIFNPINTIKTCSNKKILNLK